MNNVKTGWVTTVLGLIIMIVACLDFFGVLDIPAPQGITEMYQVSIAFVVGLVLFIMPKSFLETTITKVVNKKVD